MEKEYHKGPGLTMANLGLSLEELNGQPLELLAREGARLVLSVAMEEEVAMPRVSDIQESFPPLLRP